LESLNLVVLQTALRLIGGYHDVKFNILWGLALAPKLRKQNLQICVFNALQAFTADSSILIHPTNGWNVTVLEWHFIDRDPPFIPFGDVIWVSRHESFFYADRADSSDIRIWLEREDLERPKRIELSSPAWEAGTLPLCYGRKAKDGGEGRI